MSIEAMKQALEALETLDSGDSYKTHNAATALRKAIEQAEIDTAMDALCQAIEQAEKPWVKTYAGGKPNYTTPEEKQVRTHTPEDIKKIESKWVGLTDEDKSWAFDETQEGGGFWEFADAIEAKLKEKNT